MSTPSELPPPVTEPGEPTPVEVIATCHTDGCRMDDVPVDTYVIPNPPEFPPVLAYLCDGCGLFATDVVPVTTG